MKKKTQNEKLLCIVDDGYKLQNLNIVVDLTGRCVCNFGLRTFECDYNSRIQ